MPRKHLPSLSGAHSWRHDPPLCGQSQHDGRLKKLSVARTNSYLKPGEPNRGTLEYGKAGNGIDKYPKRENWKLLPIQLYVLGLFSPLRVWSVNVAASFFFLGQKINLGVQKRSGEAQGGPNTCAK